MKYIYKRNEYQKLNEIVDSDKLDVEFGDTIIGGTLHRLLGVGRSALKNVEIEQYAKKLDRILAGMVVEPALSELNDGKEEDITMEDLSIDGRKLVVIKDIERAVELFRNDKKEEAQKALPPHEVIETLQLVPAIISVVKQIGYTKQEVATVNVTPGDMAVYKGDQVQVIKVDGEEINVRNKEGEEGVVNVEDLEVNTSVSNDSSDANTKEQRVAKKLKEYQRKYKEVKIFCDKCEPNNKYLNQLLEQIEAFLISENSTIEKGTNDYEKWEDDGSNTELENFLSQAREKCSECDTSNSPVKESMKNDIILLLEKYEDNDDKSADAFISDSQFRSLRKELDKEASKLKVSEDDLRKLDQDINSKKGIGNITGSQAKSIMNILTKAKNSLLHAKPYEEIRKKQKRYFDPLNAGANTGRAISRKGYQKWAERVNDMLSYYKDKLPKRVLTMIADSLDKEHMSNDYVKLNKEFLGINKRGEDGKKTPPIDRGSFRFGTDDNKLGFVGVNKLQLSQKLQKISFILEVDASATGYSGYITGVVTRSRKEAKQFNFKFMTGLNSSWLDPYFGGKTINNKSLPPSDDPEDQNNHDLADINLDTKKDPQIYYAQVDIADSKGQINKNDTIHVDYASLSDYVKTGNLDGAEINRSDWTINRIGILVGHQDYSAAENNVSLNSNLSKGDKFLTEEEFDKFFNKFRGKTSDKEDEEAKQRAEEPKEEKSEESEEGREEPSKEDKRQGKEI